MPVILACWKLSQEDPKFKANLACRVSSSAACTTRIEILSQKSKNKAEEEPCGRGFALHMGSPGFDS